MAENVCERRAFGLEPVGDSLEQRGVIPDVLHHLDRHDAIEASLDGRVLGDGSAGPLTQRVLDAYETALAG